MKEFKREIIMKARNDKMRGDTFPMIAKRYNVAESTAKRWCYNNILGDAVFYPVKNAKTARLKKVISFLRENYKMNCNSCFKFVNSLGVKVSENSFHRLFYNVR